MKSSVPLCMLVYPMEFHKIVPKSLFYNNIGEDVLLKCYFQGHKDKLLIFDHFFHLFIEDINMCNLFSH